MFEELFTTIATDTLSVGTTVMILCSALILGFGVTLVYIYTHKEEDYSNSFVVSLVMLPGIIAMIILLIGNNVARAFSLAGAFSLIRFRSEPGDAKDITYIFFDLAVGLACGMGFIAYAGLTAVLLCAVIALLPKLHVLSHKSISYNLKISIPENLDYEGVFDDILRRYTKDYNLNRIKTTEFGSLFELSYRVRLQEPKQTKEFIDQIRTKNGNLDVVLTLA